MADILLYRARLFRDADALEAAAWPVEETGYHRRAEELRDARQAAQRWPQQADYPLTPKADSSDTSDVTTLDAERKLTQDSQAATQEEPMPDSNAPKQERDLVYISYSHKDKKWHKELREILDRNERIKARVWDDTKIPPGSDFRKEINTHVARAKVMIMLVSPDYLVPKCGARDCETLPAVEAAQRGELTILWVAVRESDYEHSPIGHLMAAFPPSPSLEEIKTVADQHAAWRSLCDQVLKVLGLGSHGFDVFLSHNSKDKPAVRQLAQALQQRGLKVWLDEWELPPGRPWMPMLEEILRDTRTAAVLFGPAGLGPWEEPEMRVALDQFVKRSLPVIPVLLPGASKKPELPLFLQQFGWVDVRDGLTKEGLDRLEWGITGRKPSP